MFMRFWKHQKTPWIRGIFAYVIMASVLIASADIDRVSTDPEKAVATRTVATRMAASIQNVSTDDRHLQSNPQSERSEALDEVGSSEWRKQYDSVEVVATGYSAGYESTGKTPDHPQYGITYSGLKVRRDHLSTIAADPEVFPIGTILWIPGYGYGIVADTGSAIKGNKIDLYFDSVEDVYREWGKKTVNVYVIEKGSGKVTESMFNDKLEAYRS